jgi:hypothetical protein
LVEDYLAMKVNLTAGAGGLLRGFIFAFSMEGML